MFLNEERASKNVLLEVFPIKHQNFHFLTKYHRVEYGEGKDEQKYVLKDRKKRYLKLLKISRERFVFIRFYSRILLVSISSRSYLFTDSKFSIWAKSQIRNWMGVIIDLIIVLIILSVFKETTLTFVLQMTVPISIFIIRILN